MSDHTPGPWTYDGGAQIVEEARPHMRVLFLPSDHHEYASSKPNARLAAAAPDMLAALEAVEEWWLTVQMHKESGAPYAIFAVRAAIAKATGKSVTRSR